MTLTQLSERIRSIKGVQVVELFPNGLTVKVGEGVFRFGENEDSDWMFKLEWLKDHRFELVVSKIQNKIGANSKIYARSCTVKRISQPELDDFLQQYHLNGPAQSKVKLALVKDEECVAVMSFAAPRTINGKRSAGLIRFCTKSGVSVVGGLEKLLKHYLRQFPCNDVFTYINTEWGNGEGFKKVGFVEEERKVLNGSEMLCMRKLIS